MCKTTTPSSIFLTANSSAGSRLLGTRQPTKPKYSSGRWSKKEHELFLEGLKELGKNWREISGIMKTRSPVQVRTHAQKFFLKMAKSESAVTGNDEIAVEFTSLKKDTKVMSSCLAEVKTVTHQFEYEVKLPGVPTPVRQSNPLLKEVRPTPPVNKDTAIPSTPVPTTDAGSGERRGPRVGNVVKEESCLEEPTPSLVKQQKVEPVFDEYKDKTDETFLGKLEPERSPPDDTYQDGDYALHFLDDEYSSGSASFSDSQSLSTDFDDMSFDSGMEEVILHPNNVPEGCLYETLPKEMQQPLESLCVDNVFRNRIPELNAEYDFDDVDIEVFELEDPVEKKKNVHKRKCAQVTETSEIRDEWKRLRANSISLL